MLPKNYTPCDGYDCANKTECARFLELNNRGPRTRVMRAPLGLCPFYVAPLALKSVIGANKSV